MKWRRTKFSTKFWTKLRCPSRPANVRRVKLIDRYLVRTFAVPFLYCLIAFCMIYVIFDLFDNLPDFIDADTPLPAVATYYVILLPSVAVRIVPIAIMLAVLYSLSSLTKNNELTAMRACGISMFRLMIPFAFAGLAASLIVAFVHETVAPRAAFWCDKFLSQQRKGDAAAVYVVRQVALKRQEVHRIWVVNTFDMRTYAMEGVEVLQQRPDTTDDFKITAARARWLDGQWWFYEVVEQRYDMEGNPKGAPRFAVSREMPELNETPQDFLSEVKNPIDEPEFFSAWGLYRYIRAHGQLQPETLIRMTVDLHHRLALPWTCLVVTLLGIPFGNQTGRKGALRGVALCLLLFFGFYTAIHVGLFLGKNGLVAPWLGGWLPNLVFFVVGLVLVLRMR
jgi:lipopolysaccharide export system permease protein